MQFLNVDRSTPGSSLEKDTDVAQGLALDGAVDLESALFFLLRGRYSPLVGCFPSHGVSQKIQVMQASSAALLPKN